MGWGRDRFANWTQPKRPKAEKLAKEDGKKLLAELAAEIKRSPVLVELKVEVRSARGRFYVERHFGEYVIPWGRITPLSEGKQLLLECERSQNKYFEVVRGGTKKVVAFIAGDTLGTFHGLGSLNDSLCKELQGLTRQEVHAEGNSFVFAASGKPCTVQEALFHFFGIPIRILVQPRGWYAMHRTPIIVEYSADGSRVLTQFIASTLSGAIVGTCLYVRHDDKAEPGKPPPWGAYTIRPSASESIASASVWIVKRGWDSWC